MPSPTNAARLRAIATLGREVSIATRGRSYVIAVSIESADPSRGTTVFETLGPGDALGVEHMACRDRHGRRCISPGG